MRLSNDGCSVPQTREGYTVSTVTIPGLVAWVKKNWRTCLVILLVAVLVISVGANRAALHRARLEAERLRAAAEEAASQADKLEGQLKAIKDKSTKLDEEQAAIDARVKERDKKLEELTKKVGKP